MERISLQDCLDSVIDNRGVTPHKKGTEWQTSGIPVLSANNVKTTGIHNKDEIRFIPKEIYDSWMKQPLEKGDILLTSEAPAGEVLYWDSDEKIVVGQRLYGLKIKKNINSKYLKYYLQSDVGQKAIQQQQSGSTVFGISAKTFSNIMIDLPEKPIQDKIGNTLYSIDHKININKQLNDNFYGLLRLEYDKWFYRFEGNKDGLIWNEKLKANIPSNWSVKSLGELLIESKKSSVQVNEARKNDGPYPFFTSGEEIIMYKDFFVDGFNIFMNTGGNADVKFYIGKSSYSTDTWCINGGKYSPYLYLYLLSILKYINENCFAGSGLKHLQKEHFKGINVLIPDDETLDKFNSFSMPLLSKISKNDVESRELSEIRDFLLPLLINGDIDFK
ncbi:MAG: restriction endonuclease subunit S [Candidatus Onthovivens sp.]|nr:restriction endonuclease subunit S [Candidatus Onthovivens sp.]